MQIKILKVVMLTVGMIVLGAVIVGIESTTFAQSNEGACPGFESRLEIGQPANITPGPANNVRAEATTNSTQLGQIPGGGAIEVLDGPRCADGITWWRVDYNGLVGWTGEGDSRGYWAEPSPGGVGGGSGNNSTINGIPEDLLWSLAYTSGGGVGNLPGFCDIFIDSGMEYPQGIFAVGSQSDIFRDPQEIIASSNQTVSVELFPEPINIIGIFDFDLSFQRLMPSICIPSSGSFQEATATSPDGEVIPASLQEFDNGTQVNLPLEAYQETGTWQLSVDDFNLSIDLQNVHPGVLIDHYGREFLLGGFDPREEVFVATGRDISGIGSFEVEMDTDGNYLGTFDEISNLESYEITAAVGQNQNMFSFGVYNPDGIDFFIPAEFVIWDIVWNDGQTDFSTWTCPDASPIILEAGEDARLSNNIASQGVFFFPNEDTEEVAEITSSEIISVGRGLRCVDDELWVIIEYAPDSFGLTLASKGNTYFLVPID